MLSTTSDYALRAILVLAQATDGRPLRADQIARATASPSNYLGKTLNALAKAGLVTSTRGPFGGFALAVPAAELTLARIVDCFDEPRPQTRCLLGRAPCDLRHPCSAHYRWTGIKAARRAALADTTVADLLVTAVPNQ
ncbi:MAG: Rrf2 family transcriptional regulator [Gemmatimonadetes bacterium]|jgi:Rrf2 family iron-sulfur cluster assembly transcriptional regulator|nr:Rrf2 family transcriptional regulator [Gemmatimonadota bacterium]